MTGRRIPRYVCVLLLLGLLGSNVNGFSTIAARGPAAQRCRAAAITGCPRHSIRRSTSALTTIASGASQDFPGSPDNSPEVTPDEQRFYWRKPALALAIPAILAMLSDPLLSLMDTAYVGRVGTTELAALGACTSIFHLAFNAFRATTAATTSLVASAQTEDDARRVTAVSLQVGAVVGVCVALLLRVFANYWLARMGVPRSSPLHPPAAAYLNTRCWAAPVVLATTVAEGAFRGYGNTVVPLLASAMAALLNLVLDPLFMFRPLHWGVRGAAAATALAQVGAMLVYARELVQRQLLPRRNVEPGGLSKRKIVTTILGANLAMVCKQASLLLAWAYATARATRLGTAHVAAHQVALSVWLVFALVLDGAAVAAQVLRAQAAEKLPQVQSLQSYMLKVALWQGVLTAGVVYGCQSWVPQLFVPHDLEIQQLLRSVWSVLSWQQVLVSLTLVVEALAVGAQQFPTLAWGTTVATLLSVWQLSRQTTVQGIWSVGIVTLFVGRLITALFANRKAFVQLKTRNKSSIEGTTR